MVVVVVVMSGSSSCSNSNGRSSRKYTFKWYLWFDSDYSSHTSVVPNCEKWSASWSTGPMYSILPPGLSRISLCIRFSISCLG